MYAAEEAARNAQVAAKVIQVRALKDILNHLQVSNDLAEQKVQLEHFKAQVREEKKRVVDASLRLDELDAVFTENEELTVEQIQTFVDEELLSVKTREAAQAAIDALEAESTDSEEDSEEENVQAETKLDLVRNDLRELIRAYASTDARLTQ